MAQLTYIQSHVVPSTTRMRLVGGAILALLVTGAVVLALSLPGGESPSTTQSDRNTVVPSGLRSDGGPDEGTRGRALVTPAAADRSAAGGVRFDGGPVEGTRGRPAPVVGTRFDGGPEEGTRGAR